ncbi:hypothetical protein BKA65DRAFT_234125 [Rhexocercosporidium sp. MPI-PUGE-AT-0058]|nr:hypothetical protein BKA65DRAFT_234125 [Rhexocercosporidium sp. MPI-PUGE-AT-0058]
MEDFNLPSTERTNLLKNLQEAMSDAPVPPYFWAMCQVCELQALEKFIKIARISPPIFRSFTAQAYSMILYWTQSAQGTSRGSTPITTQTNRGLGSSPTGSPPAKRQKTTKSPSSSPLAERQTITKSLVGSPLLHRSKAASDLARERDGYCCVLSKNSSIDVAHIYLFCRLSTSEENVFGTRHLFWMHLKSFWSEEKVAAWEAELFPRGLSKTGDERVDNRITLSKDAHCLWNRGAYALKPISISDDKTILRVQLFWQKKQPDMQAAMSLLTIPLSTENLNQNEGAFDHGQTILYDEGGNRIKSGDIFDLKTDDPTTKPLPSFKLLELQWFLTRVIGMAGAAFPYEAGSGDDSDEDIPGLDLDEAGDTSFLLDIPSSNSLEFLYKVNRALAESPKHHTEEVEEDRVGRGSGYVV